MKETNDVGVYFRLWDMNCVWEPFSVHVCCSSKAPHFQAALIKLLLTHSLAAAAPKMFSALSIHI